SWRPQSAWECRFGSWAAGPTPKSARYDLDPLTALPTPEMSPLARQRWTNDRIDVLETTLSQVFPWAYTVKPIELRLEDLARQICSHLVPPLSGDSSLAQRQTLPAEAPRVALHDHRNRRA